VPTALGQSGRPVRHEARTPPRRGVGSGVVAAGGDVRRSTPVATIAT
jgi:hypothetical protein